MMYEAIKDQLADADLPRSNMFTILKEISKLVNNRETYSLGRDLVIRVLARRNLLDKFEVQILISLVRIVGLYPYMRDDLEYADINDRIAYDLHRPGGIEEVFNSLQAKIYHQIRGGRNVVLSASTSVGKSLIIDAVIASENYRKVVIVVPTLALIDETRKRLSRRFGDEFAIVTHPTQASPSDRRCIYILTQERVRLRNDLNDVDFFVIDEFYKIEIQNVEDIARAVDLNLAFHQLASSGAQFYMLGPNVHALRGLDKYDVYFIHSDFSTVAVDVESFNLPARGDERPNKLAELCRQLKTPTLIYCQSIPGSTRVALNLLAKLDDVLPLTCQEDSDWLASNFHVEWIAARALRRGIGIHHGGLPRSLQQHMVRLFNEGAIQFLICTSTLIEGVNTVAENIIIYDRRRGMDALDFFTYKNIQGRAGRMGRYFIGKVFLLEKPLEEEDTYVDYAVENQTQSTPLSLLMQLDASALTEDSKELVAEALSGRFLSEQTLRSNPFVHPEVQDRIARLIQEILSQNEKAFAWNNIPSSDQLLLICGIAYNFLSKHTLERSRILSGAQLHWHLRASTTKSGIPGYLREIGRGIRPGQNITEKLDDGLRILRNITTYRFPRDLMVVHRIQAEVAERLGYPVGSYASYAENLENLFMPGVLAALDEYGIPLQVIGKLRGALGIHHELGAVLERLRFLDVASIDSLTAFEKRWVERVQLGL